MDSLGKKRQIIKKLLSEYARIPYRYGDVKTQAVLDSDNDHYLLVNAGWEDGRVHSCLVHIDIIDGHVWVQRDDTDLGIVDELEAAGISKDEIVLGFREPEDRPYTGYAVA